MSKGRLRQLNSDATEEPREDERIESGSDTETRGLNAEPPAPPPPIPPIRTSSTGQGCGCGDMTERPDRTWDGDQSKLLRGLQFAAVEEKKKNKNF